MESKSKSRGVFILLASLLTVIYTFPLILNLNKAILGYKGDNMRYIHDIWVWSQNFKNSLNNEGDINLGEIKYSRLSTQPILDGTAIVLSLASNPTVSYNILIILSFILSGYFTFLLVYDLTKNKYAASFAGISFMFTPYHIRQAQNHLEIAQTWVIPMYFISLLKFYKRRDAGTAVFGGIALGIATLVVNYYGFFLALTTALFALLELGYNFLNKTPDAKKGIFLVATLFFTTALTVAVPNYYSIQLLAKSKNISAYTWKAEGRTDQDVVKYSARPWNYLIPDIDNALFGDMAKNSIKKISKLRPYYLTRNFSSNEQSLYIGATIFLLFLFTLKKIWKENRLSKGHIISFIAALALLYTFSLFPFIQKGGFTLKMPSYYASKIFPMFRVYARAGAVANFLVIITASYGVGRIIETKKGKAFAITAVLTLLVLMEYTVNPRVTNLLPEPNYYERGLEDDIAQIVETPKLENNSTYYYQTFHQKPVYFTRITSKYKVDKHDLELNLKKTEGKSLVVFHSDFTQIFFDHRRNELGMDLENKNADSKTDEESKKRHRDWISENVNIIMSVNGLKEVYSDGKTYTFTN